MIEFLNFKLANKIAAKRKALATVGKDARETKKALAHKEVERLRQLNKKQENEIKDLKMKEEALEALVEQAQVTTIKMNLFRRPYKTIRKKTA